MTLSHGLVAKALGLEVRHLLISESLRHLLTLGHGLVAKALGLEVGHLLISESLRHLLTLSHGLVAKALGLEVGHLLISESLRHLLTLSHGLVAKALRLEVGHLLTIISFRRLETAKFVNHPHTAHYGVQIFFQFRRNAVRTKGLISADRNQFDIYQCIICSDGINTEASAANTIFLNIIDTDLTGLGNGQLIGNDTLGGQIGFNELSIFDKYVEQCLLYGFLGKRTGGNGLYVERRQCIVEGFIIVRYDGTRGNIRLFTNAGFYNTGIKADTFVVHKETVSSATAGHAAVLIDRNEVIGTQVFLAIHLFQLKEHGVVELAGADGGRVQVQDACAGAIGQIVEFLFLLVKNLDLHMGQRITDTTIFKFRRCNNAGTASFRQAIAVCALNIRTVCLQELVITFLGICRNACTAENNVFE